MEREMKKAGLFLICLISILFTVSLAGAQGSVRVKCNQFTMNVTSENAHCYQVDENILLEEGASPEQIENAQVANSAIYFSDFESNMGKIPPQVTFYLVDDLGKTSLDLLDRTLDLSDIISNIKSEFSTVEDNLFLMPFLPYQAADPTIKILPAKIDFANGTGIRYVTSFEETLSTSFNSNLYYTWQGLSDDGLYYISAVFPLSSGSLNGQSASSVNPDQINGSDFQPSLNELDYYVRSIVIE